jgi:hypothetical protein
MPSTKSHLWSEFSELREAANRLGLAMEGVENALSNWPRPLWADEAATLNAAKARMLEHLDGALADFLGDALAGLRQRADEAGIAPEAVAVERLDTVRRSAA